MATRYEATPLVEPEQRVAQLVLQRAQLKPPIDVERLARRYAVVEEDALPEESDAVVLTRREAKPLIVLNRHKPSARKRFTLAHEIGHILIPWHIGTVACHTDAVVQVDDREYAQTEAEANRFASELLMPRVWLADLVRESKGLRAAFAAAKRAADVSPQALSLALVQVLPPGYVFAAVDKRDNVVLSGTSPGTLAKCPTHGHSLDKVQYNKVADKHLEIDGVYWWRFESRGRLDPVKDPREATVILNDILQALGIRGASAAKLTQSVNGIVGAANNAMRPRSAGELLAGLRQRFLARPELGSVIEHENFNSFLAKRAQEILGRRRRSRSVPRGSR